MAEHIGTQNAIAVLSAMCFVGVSVGGLYYVSNRADVKRTSDGSRVTAAG
jgi:hypothetical protein